MFNTPVVLFVFNRPQCTQLLFAAISALQPSRLFIVADGPREHHPSDIELCARTRELFIEISWPCTVSKLYSKTNIGCRKSIPNGLSWVFQQVEECIILEDDCLPQPSFFPFCEELLERYRNEPRIMTIGGHRTDGPNEFNADSYFFSKYPNIWGWATWKHKWEKYDLMMSEWTLLRSGSWLQSILKNEQEVAYWQRMFDSMQKGLDTWDYALVFSSWLHGALSVRPKVNMITNIGFGNDATHTDHNSALFASSTDIHFPLVHPKLIATEDSVEKRIDWVSFSGMDKRILEGLRSKIKQTREKELPKILHISTYDEFGGAARAAQRIYQSLKTQSFRLEMLTLHKSSNDDSIKKPQQVDTKTNLKLIHGLLESYRIQKASPNNVLHSYGEVSAGIVNEINADEANIVHLHWICNFLSIEDIAKIEKPIVWTLHDMWPFSGSEHCSFDPEAYFYKHSSGTTSNDLPYQTWLKKLDFWKQQKFTVVAPSRGLANFAKQSILFEHSPISVIPHPINVNFWSPQSKNVARAHFNFSDNKKKILFIAKNPVNDMNKGWDLLQKSLFTLYQSGTIDFELIVVGHEGVADVTLPYTVHWLGDINNDQMLVWLYSSAHLLVVPSRAEAFSQVCLEAQACGLPAVGFDIGGLPDIINHEKTGWISKAYDTSDFSSGMQWVLEDEDLRKTMAINARKNVLEKFSPEVVAKQYLQLYDSILK